MSAPAALAHLAEIVVGRFPWLSGVRTDPATKHLAIDAANGRIDLAGAVVGAILAALARVGDGVGYFATVQAGGHLVSVWWSPTQAPSAQWVGIPIYAAPPGPTDPGLPITITSGSPNVRSG